MTAMKPAKKAIDISSIENGDIVLILTGAENYMKNIISVLKTLINKNGHQCIYVTVNRPYNDIQDVLEKGKINTDNIFFIDLISKMANTEQSRAKNCLFVNSPDSLTDLSIAITEAIGNIKGSNKFIFLDSLSTMLIYNQAGTLTKFAHFLIGKMRNAAVEMIIISLEKEMDQAVVSQISTFVDKVIKVK